jgi:hypothetical protein
MTHDRADFSMKHLASVVAVCLIAVAPATGQPKPTTLVTGLKNPLGVAVGPGGKTYVSVVEDSKPGSGAVMLIEKGKAVPFGTGLNTPRGIAVFQQWLFVADDKLGVWRIDAKGTAKIFAPASAFPTLPRQIMSITVDQESGLIYVADIGDGENGAIYRVSPQGKVSVVLDKKRFPNRLAPRGLRMDGASHLLFCNDVSGVFRVKLSDGTTEMVANNVGTAGDVIWDYYGRLIVLDSFKSSRLYAIPKPGAEPVLLPYQFGLVGGICLDSTGKNVLVPDSFGQGTLTSVPISIPGHEVDDTRCRCTPRSRSPTCNGPAGRARTTAGAAPRCGRWC